MEQNASNKARGVNTMDLGCGLVEISIPMDILEPLKDLDTASPTKVRDILNTPKNSKANKK